jgi:hypothetical protein
LAKRIFTDQNSAQFITTRPRQISLRQTILHFSWIATFPHSGQTISPDELGDGAESREPSGTEM